MKSGREPRDDSFITAHVLRETGRAHSLESADPFAAWFEYRQAAETFDGLTDVSQLQSQRKALEKQKSVVDGGKREKQEIKEQVLLSAGIFRGFASLSGDGSNNDSPPANALNNVREQIHTLKSWAEHEKRQERARVMKRALGAILVNAMEAGLARLDANDPGHARDYFELAKAADPDSVWVLTNLAVARAANGDRRDALETLRRTKEKWTDREAFTAWLNSQAAFAKLRDTPEFLSLLQ